MKILFLGDSTTDSGRWRDETYPYCLGTGYVFLIARQLLLKDQTVEIVNRGVSGDRCENIKDRFKEDCLDINADVITIMFGINDIWHPISHNAKSISTKKWGEMYQDFISRIKSQNPKAIIILMTPFLLHGTSSDPIFEDLSKVKRLQNCTKKLAKDNGLVCINLQKVLEKAATKYGDKMILFDGVHPNTLGANEIASAWIKQFSKLMK